MDTIKVRFTWKSLTPDRREWKPSSPIFEPQAVTVIVEVPMDEKYIDYFDESNPEEIRLTLDGMKYCIDEFEKVMSYQQKEFEDKDWNDDGWESADDK